MPAQAQLLPSPSSMLIALSQPLDSWSISKGNIVILPLVSPMCVLNSIEENAQYIFYSACYYVAEKPLCSLRY